MTETPGSYSREKPVCEYKCDPSSEKWEQHAIACRAGAKFEKIGITVSITKPEKLYDAVLKWRELDPGKVEFEGATAGTMFAAPADATVDISVTPLTSKDSLKACAKDKSTRFDPCIYIHIYIYIYV